MSNKQEKMMRKLQAAAVPGPAAPRLSATRFHPVRNLLLCRAKLETVSSGGIHLPGNRQAIAVPIGEVLDAGPEVKDYVKGDLILFATSAALAIDGELFVLEDSKPLAKVDPASVLQ